MFVYIINLGILNVLETLVWTALRATGKASITENLSRIVFDGLGCETRVSIACG